MSFIVFLYASGLAFFVGAALIAAAAFVRPLRSRFAKALVLIGLVVLVAPSSTPLPWLQYGALLVSNGWWWRERRHAWARRVLIAAWAATAGFEGLHLRTPAVRTGQ